jgi:LemA protein
MIPLVILLVVLLAVAGLLWSSYNSLVGLRNRIEAGWAQIEVQLKRRHDLIPNMVETVKGYAAHESGTLEKVVQARNAAVAAKGVAGAAAAENGLTQAVGGLFALSEAYPDLKANTNYLNLQEELSGTEGKIAYARQYYNDEVRSYNTKVQGFPTNLIAKRFGFKEREYFQTDEADRGPVNVKF